MEQMLLNTYIQQIQRYPLLNAEEESVLADAVASGDEAAKKRLIQCNLRLVVSVAKKYAGFKVPLMDVIQEGNIGLMTAAARYRSSFKTRFSTYAYLWIAQSILRFVRNKRAFINIPHRKESLLRKIAVARDFLYNQNGKDPSSADLSVFLGMNESEISDALNYVYSVTSLDTLVSTDSDTSIKDILPDSSFAPESLMIKSAERKEIVEMLNVLSPAEKSVIYHRFNLGYDEKTKTLRQVGELLGVSSETVRQMEIRALKHLRAAIRDTDIAMA